MKGKAALLVGAGIGYVLGTRAGNERYEAIKAQAGTAAAKVRRDPRVQQGVEEAKGKAADAAAQARHKAAEATSRGDRSDVGNPASPASSVRDDRG